MWIWRGLCADQYIHCRKLACRVEFIAQFARSGPYEEIGGYSFTERLHKDLVVMPLDLKAVGIGDGERGHGLAKFENGEMVQRGFNMADLLWLVVCAPAAATARAREIVVSVFIAAS